MRRVSYNELALEYETLMMYYGNVCHTMESMMVEFEQLEQVKRDYADRISSLKIEMNNNGYSEPVSDVRQTTTQQAGGFMDPSDDDDHHVALEENRAMPFRGNTVQS